MIPGGKREHIKWQHDSTQWTYSQQEVSEWGGECLQSTEAK